MTPRQSTDDMDDLDRLVDRELKALLDLHRAARRRPARRRPEPRDETAEPEPDRTVDNVVRAHPLARTRMIPKPHLDGLFAPDEDTFLANAADWLRGRPNADILLETLSRRVLGGDDAEEPEPVEAADDDPDIGIDDADDPGDMAEDGEIDDAFFADDDGSGPEGWGDEPEFAPPPGDTGLHEADPGGPPHGRDAR